MDTKSLWTSLDRVRGFLDQQTIFNIALYALFFKKCENDRIEPYKDQYSLNYLSRIYGELVHTPELVDYIRNAERTYGIADGILSESFKNAVARVTDSEKVRRIFGAINEFDLTCEENLMTACEQLIDKYISSIGKISGEFGTNRSLAKLEAALLNVNDDAEIYDGYCGLGISILEAGNASNKYNIRDLNPDVLAKAVITLIIHERKITSALCGDSNIENERKYRYVVSEPPFNARRELDYVSRIEHQARVISSNSLDVERIIDSLDADGRAVILVPAGMLFASGKAIDFRRYLIGRYLTETNIVKAIIGIPAGAIPGAGLATMLLVLDKGNKSDKVIMVDSESYWKGNKGFDMSLTPESIDDIKDIVFSGKAVAKVSEIVSVEDIVEKDMNMTPKIYVSPYKIEEVKIADIKELYAEESNLMHELIELNRALAEFR